MTDLEKLLAEVTPGEWVFGTYRGCDVIRMGGQVTMSNETYYPWNPDNLKDWELFAMSKDLARKVIAAEKLVEALGQCLGEMTGNMDGDMREDRDGRDMAREALASWESAK